MNEDAIKPIIANGQTCLKCEKPIAPGEGCVQVSFKVNLILTSTTKEEFAHPNCADKVASELHSAAQEARSLTRRSK